MGGVDERGSRTPPPYVGPEYMSGFGPALDFVGPALMVLTYPTGDETTGGFYDEGYISTDPDINPVDYPNMIRLPILRYSRTNMSRVGTAACSRGGATSVAIVTGCRAPQLLYPALDLPH